MQFRRKAFVATGAGVAVVAVLSILALSAGGAAAGSATTHHTTAHARVVGLDQTTAVAEVTGSDNGKWGAQIAHFTVQGSTVTGTSTSYNRHGALFGPFSFKVTANSDGSLDYAGSGQFTGGTGRYKGAHGSVKITGHQAANDQVIHLTYKSTITY